MNRCLLSLICVSAAILFACGGGSSPAASPDPAAAADGDGGAAHHGHGAGYGQHADFPACAVLAKTCHAHDKDSDKAHACHVLGHSAPSNEECEAKHAECVAICGGGDGGA